MADNKVREELHQISRLLDEVSWDIRTNSSSLELRVAMSKLEAAWFTIERCEKELRTF